MANLDLNIKNLPDDTYEVYLRRNSDKAVQFNSTLDFTSGLATAALATAADGEYIEGAVFGGNIPAIRGAIVSGYAAGEPVETITILGVGNSLSDRPVDPAGVTNNVYDEVSAIYDTLIAEMNYDYAIQGGAMLADHYANTATMAKVSSGDSDLVILQGGTADSENYEEDAQPIVDAANNAGSQVALFLRWAREDNAEYPTLRNNIVTAGANLGCGIVKIGDVWEDLRANTSIVLFTPGDKTHQNLNGSYVNSLCIYRYLSGESVQDINYYPPLLALSAGEIQSIKEAVDLYIDEFYNPADINTAIVNITAPASGTEYSEGDSITFAATATDSVTGDITSSIVWKDDLGTTLHTGGSFSSSSIVIGQRLISASAVGSDGKTTARTVAILVRSLVNVPPVASDGTRDVTYNAAFTQANLTSLVNDTDPIDWSTLEITQPTNGSAVIDPGDTSTVNLNFAGSDYSGADSFDFRVSDERGAQSNWGTIHIAVAAQVVTKQVWVALAGSGQGPEDEVVNRFSYKDANASDVNLLVDTDGVSSGWSFEGSGVAGQQFTGDSSGETTGDNSGFMPDLFLQHPAYTGGQTVIFKVTGLGANTAYSLKATGSRTGTGTRVSDLDVSGVSQSWECSENTTQGYDNNVVSDANGELLFSLNVGAGSSFAYLGGFILAELP